MLTDSRSFLSYARHDYFRRIAADILGEWVNGGEYDKESAVRLAENQLLQYKGTDRAMKMSFRWYGNRPDTA